MTPRGTASWSPATAAMGTELLKLRRGTTIRLCTVLLVVLVPLSCIGAVALARAPNLPGVTAAKFAPYAVGDLATTHLQVLGQLLSIAVLLAGGFGCAWSFGREFTDGTIGALAGLPVGRGTLALAKGLVLAGWLACCVSASAVVTIALSLAAGGHPSPESWRAAVLAWAVGLLAVGLCLPFGWVASVTRSQLGTIGVLIALVMLTQIVVTLGMGGWFPYAVPSLASGMGGTEAAQLGPASFVLTICMAPLGLGAVGLLWSRLDQT